MKIIPLSRPLKRVKLENQSLPIFIDEAQITESFAGCIAIIKVNTLTIAELEEPQNLFAHSKLGAIFESYVIEQIIKSLQHQRHRFDISKKSHLRYFKFHLKRFRCLVLSGRSFTLNLTKSMKGIHEQLYKDSYNDSYNEN